MKLFTYTVLLLAGLFLGCIQDNSELQTAPPMQNKAPVKTTVVDEIIPAVDNTADLTVECIPDKWKEKEEITIEVTIRNNGSKPIETAESLAYPADIIKIFNLQMTSMKSAATTRYFFKHVYFKLAPGTEHSYKFPCIYKESKLVFDDCYIEVPPGKYKMKAFLNTFQSEEISIEVQRGPTYTLHLPSKPDDKPHLSINRPDSEGIPLPGRNSDKWKASKDGAISFRISTEKRTYLASEQVIIHAELKNTSSTDLPVPPVQTAFGNNGDAIQFSGNHEVKYKGPFKTIPSPKDIVLPAGTMITAESRIDDRYGGFGSKGEYKIKCTYRNVISSVFIEITDTETLKGQNNTTRPVTQSSHSSSLSLGLGYGFNGKRVEIIVNGNSVYSATGTREIENYAQLQGTFLIKSIAVPSNSVTVEVIIDGHKSGKFNLDLTKGRIIEIYNYPDKGLSVTNTNVLILE